MNSKQLESFLEEVEWESILTNIGFGLLRIALILIVAWIISKVIDAALSRTEKRLINSSQVEGEPPSESQKRVETLIRLVRQALFLALWIVVSLILMKEAGIDIAPLIASAGILGLAIGFGAQNLVKDFISGFFLTLENQIRVNDVAVINGTGGLVERINFRTTVLRDLGGAVHIFPNGSINTISNLTKEWSAYIFDIGVAYKEDTDHVIEVMRRVGEEMRADSEIGPKMLDLPEIFGVDKFADSAVVIKGRIRTHPIQQWTVGREYLKRIKHAFDAENIEIPFPHLSIYTGEATTAMPLSISREKAQALLEKREHEKAKMNHVENVDTDGND